MLGEACVCQSQREVYHFRFSGLILLLHSIQVELFRVPEKHPYHTNYLPLPPYVPNSGFRACFNGDLSLVAINDAIYGPADVSGRIKFTTLPIPTPEMSEKASDANRRGLARADLVPEFSACSEYILYTDSQRQRAGSLRVEIYHLTENGAFRVILPDGLSLEKPFHAQFVMHPVLPVLAVGSWTFSSKQARPEVALECWTLELDDPRSWLLVDRTELGFRGKLPHTTTPLFSASKDSLDTRVSDASVAHALCSDHGV